MSGVITFTDSYVGGAQPSYAETYDILATSGAPGSLTANQAQLVLVRVGRPLLITKLSVYVGTQSGNLDLGIYTGDGSTFTQLLSTGSTAVGTGNTAQTITVAATVLAPGIDYWLAVAIDNTTATISRVSGTSGANNLSGSRNLSKATSFPLPSSLSSMSASGIAPYIVARP